MMIRSLLCAVAFGAVVSSGPAAQERRGPSQDDLEKWRAEKLAKEVFDKAAWFLDYDEARAQAKKEGKFLFVYFTRSYAP